jgi:hypothetical protein
MLISSRTLGLFTAIQGLGTISCFASGGPLLLDIFGAVATGLLARETLHELAAEIAADKTIRESLAAERRPKGDGSKVSKPLTPKIT